MCAVDVVTVAALIHSMSVQIHNMNYIYTIRSECALAQVMVFSFKVGANIALYIEFLYVHTHTYIFEFVFMYFVWCMRIWLLLLFFPAFFNFNLSVSEWKRDSERDTEETHKYWLELLYAIRIDARELLTHKRRKISVQRQFANNKPNIHSCHSKFAFCFSFPLLSLSNATLSQKSLTQKTEKIQSTGR